MRTVFQFPTFPMRDPTIDPARVPGLPDRIAHWRSLVAAHVDVPDGVFAHPDRIALVDDAEATRRAHLACFIENLAVAEWYVARGGAAQVVTSYSMGLYPTLVHTGALATADALRVMEGACAAAHDLATDGPYAMLALTGPDAGIVDALLAAVAPTVERTDRYALDTHLITGRADAVRAVQSAAHEGGWTDTMLLPVSAPFHATALRGAQSRLQELVAGVAIADPRCPIRSSTAPVWLRTASDVRDEILRNVWSPMDWADTILAIAADGPAEFIECGTSRRLSNVAMRLLGPTHRVRALSDDSLPAT
jgi:[acyl-carrier-protein] S-malonyltransferase